MSRFFNNILSCSWETWCYWCERPLSFTTCVGKPARGFQVACRSWRPFAQVMLSDGFPRPWAFIVSNPPSFLLMRAAAPYRTTGRSSREEERIVLKELVPTLACRNSSMAGVSGFWSSVVRYSRSL